MKKKKKKKKKMYPFIWKFQEDPIKTEKVMLMTKSNKGFFSNQRK